MERKIGEVFIYHGKTYQVIKSYIGLCTSNIRSDKTSVCYSCY